MPKTYAFRAETLALRSLADSAPHGVAVDAMNRLGAEGWDLVGMIPLPGPCGPESAIFFFRREQEPRSGDPERRDAADAGRPARAVRPREPAVK